MQRAPRTTWRSWYALLPWEDWRHGKPDVPGARSSPGSRPGRPSPALRNGRSCDAAPQGQRLRIAFGCDGAAWDEEKVLERYELLCEAGIARRRRRTATAIGASQRAAEAARIPLLGDQARVLASAIGELRRAIKCRPVVFELMPEVFTLFELQKTVEAILGPHLHKQNFRRLVEGCGLVEPTGELRFRTGGRPAQLFRFRRDVMLERPAPGVRVKAGRH